MTDDLGAFLSFKTLSNSGPSSKNPVLRIRPMILSNKSFPQYDNFDIVTFFQDLMKQKQMQQDNAESTLQVPKVNRIANTGDMSRLLRILISHIILQLLVFGDSFGSSLISVIFNLTQRVIFVQQIIISPYFGPSWHHEFRGCEASESILISSLDISFLFRTLQLKTAAQ